MNELPWLLIKELPKGRHWKQQKSWWLKHPHNKANLLIYLTSYIDQILNKDILKIWTIHQLEKAWKYVKKKTEHWSK